jgi:hypothetical protein
MLDNSGREGIMIFMQGKNKRIIWQSIMAALLLSIILTVAFGCSPAQYMLSVTSVPEGGGNVSPSAGVYDEGTELGLVAVPARYYEFVSWSGDASSTDRDIAITMDADKNITATFAKIMYDLEVTVSPQDAGAVDIGSGTYEAGSHVMLSAKPAPGYVFSHWEGSIPDTSSNLDFIMNGDKTLTAVFVEAYTLTVISKPEEGGTVTPSQGEYRAGTGVILRADANFPYAFALWSGADENFSNPTRVTVKSDTEVTCTFVELIPGEPQIVEGVYTGAQASVPISLFQGQWVKGTIKTQKSVPIVVVDDYYDTIKDYGRTTEADFTFQAGAEGIYSIVIKGSLVPDDTTYTVTYTMYSWF